MESRLSDLPNELITEIADIDEQAHSTLSQLSKRFNTHLSRVWLTKIKRDFTHYYDTKMLQRLSSAGYYYFLCQKLEIPQAPSGEIHITKLTHVQKINLLEKAIKKGMECLAKHLIKTIPIGEFSEEHCYALFKALSHQPHVVTIRIADNLLKIIKKFPDETQHNIIICGIKEYPKRNNVFTPDVVTLLFSSLPISLRKSIFESDTSSPAGLLENMIFPLWSTTFTDVNFIYDFFPHLNNTRIHEEAIYNILFMGLYNISKYLTKTQNALSMLLNLIPNTRKPTLAKEMLDFVNAVCFENVTAVLALPQLPAFLKMIIDNELTNPSNNSDSSDDEENISIRIISKTGHDYDDEKPNIYILAKTIFCLSQIVDLGQLQKIIDSLSISEYERTAVLQLCVTYAITGKLNDKIVNYFFKLISTDEASSFIASFSNALIINKIKDKCISSRPFKLAIDNDLLIETMNEIFLFYLPERWSILAHSMGPPTPLRRIINSNPDLPWHSTFNDLLDDYHGDIKCVLSISQDIKQLEETLALFMSSLIESQNEEAIIALLNAIRHVRLNEVQRRKNACFEECLLAFLDWLVKLQGEGSVKHISALCDLNDPRLIRAVCAHDLRNQTDIFPIVKRLIDQSVLLETLCNTQKQGSIFRYLCNQMGNDLLLGMGSMALRAYFNGDENKIDTVLAIYELLSEYNKDKFLTRLLADTLQHRAPISKIHRAYLEKLKISPLYFNYLISIHFLFSLDKDNKPHPYKILNILQFPEWSSFTKDITRNILFLFIFNRNYNETIKSIQWLEVTKTKSREEIIDDFLRNNLDLDHDDKQFLSNALNTEDTSLTKQTNTTSFFSKKTNTIPFSIWKRKIETNHHHNLKTAFIEVCNDYINDFTLVRNRREITAHIIIEIIQKIFNMAPISNDDYHFKLAALKIILLGLEDYLIKQGGQKFLSHLKALKMRFPEYFSNIDDLKLNYNDLINFISNKLKLASAKSDLTKSELETAAQEIVDYLAPCHFKKPFFEIGLLNTSTNLKR